jgi:hypothetical protein
VSARRVDRLALALLVSGLLLVIWGVLHVSSAGYGDSPFERERRTSYNEVKRATHGALPGGLLRALPGGLLLVLAQRRFERARRAEHDEHEESA